MHACMDGRKHACEHVRMHVSIQVCTHVRMYACTHVRMYACTHVCIRACMHARMYACEHVCMHEHVHACRARTTQRIKTMQSMACTILVHEEKFQKNWVSKATVCMRMRKACARMHASTWTFRMSERSCRKELHARNERNAWGNNYEKNFYACGSMLACPTMPCHGARMRHATCDMYVCATINLTCYDVYV